MDDTSNLMMRMKAAVLKKPRELVVQEVEEPGCPTGGAVIRVTACAICPTDIKMARVGQRDLVYPRILGHEVVGTVEELDGMAEGVEVGDTVQVWPGVSCGSCPSCQRGQDNLCTRQGILGFNRDGGFAELMAVPAETVRHGGLIPVPDGVDHAAVALAEPLACCVHAQDASRVSTGDVVLIFGSGPLGLLHTALARHHGAVPIVAEPDPERRKLAVEMGAEAAAAPSEIAAALDATTGGRGADVAILSAPQVAVDDALLDRMAPGGRICAFSGRPKDASGVTFDVNRLHYRELALVGSYGCTRASDAEAVRLICQGKVDVARLITKQMALDNIEDGFKMIEERRALKCVITEF